MDALSASFDYDVDPGDPQGLVFIWTCRQIDEVKLIINYFLTYTKYKKKNIYTDL